MRDEMKGSILMGGSGNWQGRIGELRVWGHCPRNAPSAEVIGRQVARQLRGELPTTTYPRLGGGYAIEIALPENAMEMAHTVAIRRAVSEGAKAISHLAGELAEKEQAAAREAAADDQGSAALELREKLRRGEITAAEYWAEHDR